MKTIILEVKREMLQFNTITMEVDDDQLTYYNNPHSITLWGLLYSVERLCKDEIQFLHFW